MLKIKKLRKPRLLLSVLVTFYPGPILLLALAIGASYVLQPPYAVAVVCAAAAIFLVTSWRAEEILAGHRGGEQE